MSNKTILVVSAAIFSLLIVLFLVLFLEGAVDEPLLGERELQLSEKVEPESLEEENLNTDRSVHIDRRETIEPEPIPPIPVSSEVALADSISVEAQSGSGLITAIVVLSITTLISVAISFWLYRWRKILLGELKALAPEEFAGHVNSLVGQINQSNVTVGNGMASISQGVGRVETLTENMVQTFMSLQNAIDQKENELNRYKAGYDSQIFRKFINRFLRVDQIIKDYIEDSSDEVKEKLGDVKIVLTDALDDCGVELFSPNEGEEYSKAEGVADRPKIIETEKSEEQGLIAGIIEAGYRMKAGEGYEVILPSKVSVYAYVSKGE